MATLLLRLEGPIQSWGITGRISVRDAGNEPSKSGVVGLLAAALGRDRSEDVSDLAALRMGVRVEREGKLDVDYSSTLSWRANNAKKNDLRKVLIWRYFLADAAFLVGIEGDAPFLKELHNALRNPHWPLCLGRKACSPSVPVWMPDAVVEDTLENALTAHPRRDPDEDYPLRYVIERLDGQELRMDNPLGNRRFAPRWVRTSYL